MMGLSNRRRKRASLSRKAFCAARSEVTSEYVAMAAEWPRGREWIIRARDEPSGRTMSTSSFTMVSRLFSERSISHPAPDPLEVP